VNLLIDMNLAPRWIEWLRTAGFEAAHWSTKGKATARDIEIMEYAASHDYIVLTHDLDFGSILAITGGGKPSVVQIRAEDLRPEIIGPKIAAALKQMQSELKAGALITVDPNRIRLNLLPLRREP
jgi:predicted nuclease of predicted toxin-antitoxin system